MQARIGNFYIRDRVVRISLRQSALGAELQRLGVSEAHLERFRAVVVGQLFVRSEHAHEQAFEDFAKSS